MFPIGDDDSSRRTFQWSPVKGEPRDWLRKVCCYFTNSSLCFASIRIGRSASASFHNSKKL